MNASSPNGLETAELALALHYLDCLSSGRVADELGRWQPDGQFRSRPLGSVPVRALQSAMRAIFGQGQIRFKVDRVIQGGRSAAVFGRSEATGDGVDYCNKYCWLFDIDSQGQIVRLTEYYDTAHSNEEFIPRRPPEVRRALRSPDAMRNCS